MIPVENPTGGAAAVSHDQPEWTPDQYAYQIAYIENNGNHEQRDFAEDPRIIQNTDDCDQNTPEDKYFIGSFCGVYNVTAQRFLINFIFNRLEPIGKQFLGAQRHFVLDGKDLQNHIDHPYHPQ